MPSRAATEGSATHPPMRAKPSPATHREQIRAAAAPRLRSDAGKILRPARAGVRASSARVGLWMTEPLRSRPGVPHSRARTAASQSTKVDFVWSLQRIDSPEEAGFRTADLTQGDTEEEGPGSTPRRLRRSHQSVWRILQSLRRSVRRRVRGGRSFRMTSQGPSLFPLTHSRTHALPLPAVQFMISCAPGGGRRNQTRGARWWR
jgi:hypothetical protein